MKKLLSIILITISALMFSCSTDFEINAPWQDITVVYSLLNSNDTTHYVKITKAFLGDISANVMAQESGNVFLKKLNDKDEVTQTIQLYHTDDIIKDDGVFSTENNIVYKTLETIEANSKYKLEINIPGKEEITSTTFVIGSISLLSNFSSQKQKINFSGTTTQKVEWKSAENVKIYELSIDFYYYEIYYNAIGNDTVLKYLNWKLPTKFAENLSGNSDMLYEISGDAFLGFLSSNIPANNKVIYQTTDNLNGKELIHRVVKQNSEDLGCLDFYFVLGGPELNTYLEVNAPSSGIVSERPAYTNINGGKGLFSSRSSKTILAKKLTDKSIDSIASGKFTKELKFLDSDFIH